MSTIFKDRNWKFFKSLRFRILVILVVIGIVPSVIIENGILNSYEERTVTLRSNTVKTQCDILCNQLINQDYVNNPTSEVINGEFTLLSNVYSGRILIINEDYKVIKDTYDLEKGKTIISEEVVRSFRGESTSNYDKENNYIEMTIPIEDAETQKIYGVMLISISTNEIVASLAILEQKGLYLLTIIVLLVLIFGYILAGILVKPFARVTRSIEDLTDGYLDENISVRDYTETELITDAFNKMLTRVKSLDDSRQEFVSNVSHELKTPLTSMKVLADSLVGQENVPIELYQEFMQDIT
ncbi:MAG TPA: histidine kinase dimerization/phospho-acceptor domain-containing protein, partial [Lachnospiraceae bacterium]